MIYSRGKPIYSRVAHFKPTFSPGVRFLQPMSDHFSKNQLRFGSKSEESESSIRVPFHQTGDSRITRQNPVSGNNCQICAIKNMLSYYGCQPNVIENFMGKSVKPALLANPAGIVPIDGVDELNNAVLREIVSEQSEIKIGRPLQLGVHNGLINCPDAKEATTDFLNQCAAIGDSPDPLLINIAPNVAGAVGRKASEANGHAFFAYPSRNGSGNWHIVDSLEVNIRKLTRQAFDDYIFKNTHCTVQIYPVVKGPNPQKMSAFEPLNHQSLAPDIKPESKSKSGLPLQSKSKWTQIKQWVKLKWNSLTRGLKKLCEWVKRLFTLQFFRKGQI